MLANINNQTVTQSARIKLNGQVVPVHQVRYFIGDQGPFTDAFEGDQFTPENVQTAQAARIVNLHEIGVPLPQPPMKQPGNPGYQIPIVPTPPVGAPVGPAPAPTGHFTYTPPAKV